MIRNLLVAFSMLAATAVTSACSCGPPSPEFFCKYYSGADHQAVLHVEMLPLVPYYQDPDASDYILYFQPIVVLEVINESSAIGVGDTLNIPVGNTAFCEVASNTFESLASYVVLAEYLDTLRQIYVTSDSFVVSDKDLVFVGSLCAEAWVEVEDGRLTAPSHPGMPRFTIAEFREDLEVCAGIVAVRPLEERIDLQVFPNPASDFLRVSWRTDRVRSVSLIDMGGRAVAQRQLATVAQSLQLPVAGLAPGFYFLRLTTDEGSVTKKVVVR